MYITESKVTYLNIAKGAMKRSTDGKEISGFVGAITGIALKRKQYMNNPPITELRVGLQSPNIATMHILCSTFEAHGTVTTFARMLLARLGSSTNNICQGEVLEIRAYDAGETNGACCSVRRHGHLEYLQGAPIPKEPRENCLLTCEKIVQHLVKVHGELQTDSSFDDSEVTPEAIPANEHPTKSTPSNGEKPNFADDNDLPF